MLNDRIDATLCIAFLVITWTVVIASARVWLRRPDPRPATAGSEALAA